MLTFQLNFVSEVYIMDLMLLSQEMCMTFQLITILLINLTYKHSQVLNG